MATRNSQAMPTTVTKAKSASRKVQWAAIQPPPCEVNSDGLASRCARFTQCKVLDLACKEFRSYLSGGRSSRSADPRPSRKLFDKVFSEDD